MYDLFADFSTPKIGRMVVGIGSRITQLDIARYTLFEI